MEATNLTLSWASTSGQLDAVTDPSRPSTLDNSVGLQLKMSRKEFDIYMAFIDVDFYLSVAVNLMAVLCNFCILKVTSYNRPLSVPQVYIAAIAICDLFIGVFTEIAEVLNRLRCRPQWARVLCIYTFWPSFGIVTGFAMSASLIAMYLSVDRLISLKFPLQHHALSSPKIAKVLTISTTILTQLLSVNFPLRLKIVPTIGNEVLDLSFTQYTALGRDPVLRKVCFSIEFVVRFALPLAIMLVTNTWTLHCIAVNSRKRKHLAPSCKAPQKTKYLAVTLGVVTIFFITQSVRTAFLLDSLIFSNQHRGLFITEMTDLLGRFLTKINSVVNIFIYLAFDRQFREKFFKLIRCSELEPMPGLPPASRTQETGVSSEG